MGVKRAAGKARVTDRGIGRWGGWRVGLIGLAAFGGTCRPVLGGKSSKRCALRACSKALETRPLLARGRLACSRKS